MARSQVIVKADISKILPKVSDSVTITQMALSQQVLKDSNFYIPKRTGNLERTGITASNLQKGELVWDAPYARRVYQAVGITIQKKVNPNASPEWFEKAKSVHLSSWVAFSSAEMGKKLKG